MSKDCNRLPDDDAVLAQVRAGDTAAFGVLWERHEPPARALARFLAHSAQDVDDIVAEAFAKVLNAIENGAGPTESFRPYLMMAVRRTAWRRCGAPRDTPCPTTSRTTGWRCSTTTATTTRAWPARRGGAFPALADGPVADRPGSTSSRSDQLGLRQRRRRLIGRATACGGPTLSTENRTPPNGCRRRRRRLMQALEEVALYQRSGWMWTSTSSGDRLAGALHVGRADLLAEVAHGHGRHRALRRRRLDGGHRPLDADVLGR